MHEQALRTYLDEHLVGARTITSLVERRLDDGVGPDWLEEFRAELEDERRILEGIAEALEGSGSVPARTAGVVSQAAARGALRLTQVLDPALRDLSEFEAMRVGVEGKGCLWRTLEVLEGHPALAGVELDMLQRRASEQADNLERFRLQAVEDLAD